MSCSLILVLSSHSILFTESLIILSHIYIFLLIVILFLYLRSLIWIFSSDLYYLLWDLLSPFFTFMFLHSYIFWWNTIEEIKATKSAIGGHTLDEQHFDSHEIKLQQGDSIYLFTDGYADQFNGKTGKKIMTKRLKDFLLSIQSKTMREQKDSLEEFVENWRSGVEQVDDILILGIRLWNTRRTIAQGITRVLR